MTRDDLTNGTELPERTRRFEAAVLPHLGAAYNLARWLLRDDHNAQDVVQEAYLRAFKFFDSYRGIDARPWLLSIVRNTCFTWLKENARGREHVEFDEERDSGMLDPGMDHRDNNPENLLLLKLGSAQIDRVIAALPPIFREVIILRELEELSYEEIANIAAIPPGTVMSRLARARSMMRNLLVQAGQEG